MDCLKEENEGEYQRSMVRSVHEKVAHCLLISLGNVDCQQT